MRAAVSTSALFLASLVVLGAAGCQRGKYPRSAADCAMFGPQAVRVHPTFTRTKDWTGDGKPDGVEAVLELQDEFGEPTRATGRAMFEVYQYRPNHPDPRGRRAAKVWEWSLLTRPQQVDHWSRALRAYSFKIPFDPGQQTMVLAAIFELNGGKPRLFDQIILEPSGRTTPAPDPEAGAATRPARTRRAPRPPVTQPTTMPTTLPTDSEAVESPSDLDAADGDPPAE